MRDRRRRAPAWGVAFGMALLAQSLPVATMSSVALAQSRLQIIDEPRGSAVGVAVVIGTGSAWEMRQETGLTYLAARSVVEDLASALAPSGGRAAVECDRSGIRFTLAVPAVSWETGTEEFLKAIFERPPSSAAIERARRAILREFSLTEESLASEIRIALAGAEYGAANRWARPPCGTAQTIAALRASDVRRMAETRFTPYRATAAIVGPVGDAEPRQLMRRFIPDSELPVLVPAPTGTTPMRRQWIERNTITSWIGLGFPFTREADLEAIRFLAFTIERGVEPAPTRPEIYDAAVEIAQHGGGGTFMVYLVTAPAQASEWVSRVTSLVRQIADTELQGPTFEALRRRYAGHRLLELESPEARARDAALQLFFEDRYSPPEARIDRLGPAALLSAARALEGPVMAHLGPR